MNIFSIIIVLVTLHVVAPAQEQRRSGEKKTREVQERRLPSDPGVSKFPSQLREIPPGFQSVDTSFASPGNPGMGQEGVQNRADIFVAVQEGLQSNDVSLFSRHFGSQVVLNLRAGEAGSYSSNQAFYVLENYLRTRRVVSFEFTTTGESAASRYATGGATLSSKGGREFVQVYVSLSRTGGRWVISQINIY